ncbi:MAG TPA: hypothetical protein VGI39_10590 [Polyangiaceae bacterium]|jgi:hypothetical protein
MSTRLLGFLPFLGLALSVVACGAPPESGSESHGTSTQTQSSLACGSTVAAYCAGASCLHDWNDADTVCMNADGDGSVKMSMSCGSFLALEQSSGTGYYDTTTSALVALVDANGKCVAGPSSFTVPAASECAYTACGAMHCGSGPGAPTPNY